MRGSRVLHAYGGVFSNGSTPRESARRFLDNEAGLFGAEADDLVSVRPAVTPAAEDNAGADDSIQSVMADSKTGRPRFHVLTYRQTRNGIPVFGSRLRVLLRNEEAHPVVMATSSLKDLGTFSVDPAFNVSVRVVAKARQFAESEIGGLMRFSQPELVIWAGTGESEGESPRLAFQFIGGSGRRDDPQNVLFVAEAVTGRLLHKKSLSYDDVSGSVHGYATHGFGAEACESKSLEPLPYALVKLQGGNPFYTDAQGRFTIPTVGTGAVAVGSLIGGNWFVVYDYGGSVSTPSLIKTVAPGQAVDFAYNTNPDEYTTAVVNAYLQANVVRDFILKYSPNFPGINRENFLINVNVNATCNASFDTDGDDPRTANVWLNFRRAGNGCANTAFPSVIHHEYGHYLVFMAGSEQGQYGEGVGDVLSVLMSDSPDLGLGFFTDCQTGLRSAISSLQYECQDANPHMCAPLLSGAVWDTRNALKASRPDDYRDILSSLIINSLVTARNDDGKITPAITLGLLTLDDDDDNLQNGTPHYCEIDAGFAAHGMGAPYPYLKFSADRDSIQAEGGRVEFRIEACGNNFPVDVTLDFGDGTPVYSAKLERSHAITVPHDYAAARTHGTSILATAKTVAQDDLNRELAFAVEQRVQGDESPDLKKFADLVYTNGGGCAIGRTNSEGSNALPAFALLVLVLLGLAVARVWADRAFQRRAGFMVVAFFLFSIASAYSKDDTYEVIPKSFPKEWTQASVDPRGGRYSEAARPALAEFQNSVVRANIPVPYGHFANPRTVFMSLAASRESTEPLLGTLLTNEKNNKNIKIIVFIAAGKRAEFETSAAYAPYIKSKQLLFLEYDGELDHIDWTRDYSPIVSITPDGNKIRLVQPLHEALGAQRERYKDASTRVAKVYEKALGKRVDVVPAFNFSMEGGNLLTDGKGTCFTTTKTIWKNLPWVSEGRDPDLLSTYSKSTITEVEGKLKYLFGCQRVIFLEPQRENGTKHVDMMIAVTDSQNIVVSMPEDVRKNGEPQTSAGREADIIQRLLKAGYTVHRAPTSSDRETYTNILVTEDAVYVPQYPVKSGTRPDESGAKINDLVIEQNRNALGVYQRLFPGKTIVPIDGADVSELGGSVHCRTHECPVRLDDETERRLGRFYDLERKLFQIGDKIEDAVTLANTLATIRTIQNELRLIKKEIGREPGGDVARDKRASALFVSLANCAEVVARDYPKYLFVFDNELIDYFDGRFTNSPIKKKFPPLVHRKKADY